MSNDYLFLRAFRKEDFLNLTFGLVNIKTEGIPVQLVRKETSKPALLIVEFPPQHIAEEVYRNYPLHFAAPTVPARARMAGPSRLVFKFPDDENSWPLNLETLLNWEVYEPILANNALPPGAQNGEGLKEPESEVTALEIPTGLYLSPDKFGKWTHCILPAEHEGIFELWHTRLGACEPEEEGDCIEPQEGGTARVIWNPNVDIPYITSLTQEERNSIAHLTSDFSIPKIPKWLAECPCDGEELWHIYLSNYGLPLKYIPTPVNVRRLMLSSMGAWANLESSWKYPKIIPEQNDNLGYPLFPLEQWQHIATQGRDQYVKTVKNAFLCDTGHRVSIVIITERKFRLGPGSPNTSTALLHQICKIEIQEPVKNYSEYADAYPFKGREMPFKSIRITTSSTPVLDNLNCNDSQPFWPMVNGKPFCFTMIGEDCEGKMITFERPLLCVPLPENGQIPWNQVVQKYNTNDSQRRWVPMYSQSISFAENTNEIKGKTSLKTEKIEFEAQIITGDNQQPGQPLFLPIVKSAEVSLPSVEQLLGRQYPVVIQFEQNYLDYGFNSIKNKGEVFAKLIPELELPFPAEKAGGLIKPDSTIEGLSRSIGTVANINSIKEGNFDTNIFDHARFLGGITLRDILKTVSFDIDEIKEVSNSSQTDLEELLQDSNRYIKVPMLTSHPFADGAIETRFLWKPMIKDYPSQKSFFNFMTQGEETGFDNNAQLVIHVSLITSINGPSTYTVKGELKEFALNFAKALKLRFESLNFSANNGKKMDVSAKGMNLEFDGALKFINTIKNILPADGFNDPPYLDITASGIRAGYTLGLPSVVVGIFSLQNINLSAGLTLPFADQPAGVRFSISERHKPFLVTVGLFGGGGFFSLALSAKGIEEIEASIEFGGNISLNLGVASGGVFVMAGIYFGMMGNDVKLTGYLRCGGYLSVLGLISISAEFYLGFTYREKDNEHGEVWGQAALTVGVKVAFFSKSVTLKIERRFAGAAGDPTFAQMMGPEQEGEYPTEWEKYCHAFA
ncbi:hypothetical protein J0801_27680 [Bacillus cereus]|uniref:hypothetical protein n=1 Tax=Bacillus cereus TaxID=1396 RepID=UPI002AC1CC44|nr:hypothetical protein [Bacillus cereus]